MLETKCPKCKSTLASPFLCESQVAECKNCGASFPVTEVLISAGPYSIYRDVLIKNIHKYVGLLREAKSELSELEAGGENSITRSESAKTVNLFISRLKELLDGCRDKLRIPGTGSTVEFTLHGETRSGALINISSRGICINMKKSAHMISPGVETKLKIIDKSLSEPLTLHGEVVWNTDKGLTGLILTDLDESTQKALWSFIREKGSLKDIEY